MNRLDVTVILKHGKAIAIDIVNSTSQMGAKKPPKL